MRLYSNQIIDFNEISNINILLYSAQYSLKGGWYRHNKSIRIWLKKILKEAIGASKRKIAKSIGVPRHL